jgi:hypothetical protein
MTRTALALAVVAAWLLFASVRTSRQRLVAIGLSALLAIDVGRLLPMSDAAHHAAFVLWYGVTAAIVTAALWRPAHAPILLAFAVLAMFRGTGPPAHWLALAVQVAAVVIYLSPRPVPLPGQVETVALLVAASSLADVAGPWLLGAPVRDWRMGQLPAVATWLAVAGWETRCWIRARRGRG